MVKGQGGRGRGVSSGYGPVTLPAKTLWEESTTKLVGVCRLPVLSGCEMMGVHSVVLEHIICCHKESAACQSPCDNGGWRGYGSKMPTELWRTNNTPKNFVLGFWCSDACLAFWPASWWRAKRNLEVCVPYLVMYASFLFVEGLRLSVDFHSKGPHRNKTQFHYDSLWKGHSGDCEGLY